MVLTALKIKHPNLDFNPLFLISALAIPIPYLSMHHSIHYKYDLEEIKTRGFLKGKENLIPHNIEVMNKKLHKFYNKTNK